MGRITRTTSQTFRGSLIYIRLGTTVKYLKEGAAETHNVYKLTATMWVTK
jgi:hypothetical protein